MVVDQPAHITPVNDIPMGEPSSCDTAGRSPDEWVRPPNFIDFDDGPRVGDIDWGMRPDRYDELFGDLEDAYSPGDKDEDPLGVTARGRGGVATVGADLRASCPAAVWHK